MMTPLKRSRMCNVLFTLSCGLVLFTSLVVCQSINPLQESDILQSYRLSNYLQCQRLCWYSSSCARYSFFNKNDSSLVKGDNCVLHVQNGGGDLVEGWMSAKASPDGLPGDHDCLSRPCMPAEICIPGQGHTNAVCRPAPTVSDVCASNPCQNGGQCVRQVGSYTCNCTTGYEGDHCQNVQDVCASNPCQNGGQCVRQVGSYTCNCTTGYEGDHCQNGTWLNSACNGSCPWPMTDCFSGRCLCRDGYYFSHTLYACVASCSSFHDTFLKYQDMDFHGHDMFGGGNNDSATCVALCVAEPGCQAFVHFPESLWTFCFFKNVSTSLYPEAWTPSNLTHVYQRTCV